MNTKDFWYFYTQVRTMHFFLIFVLQFPDFLLNQNYFIIV